MLSICEHNTSKPIYLWRHKKESLFLSKTHLFTHNSTIPSQYIIFREMLYRNRGSFISILHYIYHYHPLININFLIGHFHGCNFFFLVYSSFLQYYTIIHRYSQCSLFSFYLLSIYTNFFHCLIALKYLSQQHISDLLLPITKNYNCACI